VILEADSQESYDLTAGLVFKPTPVWASGSEDLIVVVHESGYGTQQDLGTLIADLEGEVNAVTTVPCGAP
jgi:hypothetical protein